MKDEYQHSEEYLKYLKILPADFYLTILENCFCEITVTNEKGGVLYANPMCYDYHGISPEQMWKLNFINSFQGFWTPPTTAYALEAKRTVIARQQSLLTGDEHVTVTKPLYDEKDDLKFLVYTTIKERSLVNFDLDYRKNESVQVPEEKNTIPENTKSENNIVGRSYALYSTLTKLRMAAKSDIPILLLGESGVGKSLIAKFVHDCSPRKKHPFISINCASIPDNLIESELFGYVPYAFTGASPKGKKGLVEIAHNGTLFLDEIGELQPNIQVKLLDFLENQRFTSVGGLEAKTVNTRIVTATNKDLTKLIEENKFREDLYWRINGISQTIPSLRERKNDILPIAQYYLKKYNEKYNENKIFSSSVLERLANYPWPGNIRQLKNAVEQMAVMTIGSMINEDKLPEQITEYLEKEKVKSRGVFFDDLVEDYKKTLVENYYNLFKNTSDFAQALGLSQTTAYRLIKNYIKK